MAPCTNPKPKSKISSCANCFFRAVFSVLKLVFINQSRITFPLSRTLLRGLAHQWLMVLLLLQTGKGEVGGKFLRYRTGLVFLTLNVNIYAAPLWTLFAFTCYQTKAQCFSSQINTERNEFVLWEQSKVRSILTEMNYKMCYFKGI